MTVVLFDVDTQADFVYKENGKNVYTPGAEKLTSNWRMLVESARENGIRIIGDVDSHRGFEPELKRNGGPFDDHCMEGTEGWRHVPETEPQNPIYVPNRELNETEMRNLLRHPGEIYFEKQTYNVWDNPNTDPVLKALGVKRAVVYGVATDYCVKDTVIGLLRSSIEVWLVVDAIAAINAKKGDEEMAMHAMKAAAEKSGAMLRLVTAKEAVEMLARERA